MKTVAITLAVALAGLATAQDKKGSDDPPALAAASGVVDKADKDAVVITPRAADGKFQKAVTLKVTGTSKVAVLAPQKRADKVVLTQRDAEPKDLVPGQAVVAIYAEAGKDGPVLLSAVAQPPPGK